MIFTTFPDWQTLLNFASEGGAIWYHAPLDIRPKRVSVKRRGRGRKLRVEVGYGGFWADAGHLDRFRREKQPNDWKASEIPYYEAMIRESEEHQMPRGYIRDLIVHDRDALIRMASLVPSNDWRIGWVLYLEGTYLAVGHPIPRDSAHGIADTVDHGRFYIGERGTLRHVSKDEWVSAMLGGGS